MDSPINRGEHEEFRARMEEENRRQDARIKALEDRMDKNQSLTLSVEKLACNMESMVKEQESQGKRLETLEQKDGQRAAEWLKTIGGFVIGVASTILAAWLRSVLGF